MKKSLYIFILAIIAPVFSACDSFLDRQEDEQMTEEKIWKSYENTKKYFFNCMGYLPNEASQFHNGMVNFGGADEASMTWNYPYRHINFGSWNVTNIPCDKFELRYQALRDCNIFLRNVLNCSDPIIETDSSRKEMLEVWYYCVRWARAYNYFLLMRDYGPVILLGDELIDFTARAKDIERQRNPWSECVEYVVSEMTLCAEHLPESYNYANMGLPTKGTALAVISRLLLYSARPQFNGYPVYRSVRNPDGSYIFPPEFDAQKWVKSAEAAKAVIDLGIYKLYKDADHPDDPYLNYYGIFQKNWNEEIIYVDGGIRNRRDISVHVAPTDIATASGGAYGGWGPTQSSVDSYAMSNGRYPITGYKKDGTPIVDELSSYPDVENEFDLVSIKNPFLKSLGTSDADATSNSPQMYYDREPRFYVSVYYPGAGWKHGSAVGRAYFADGAVGHTTHDYPKTGYLVNKFYDHTMDSYQGQWGTITFPTYRYAEILVNFIESELECEANGVRSSDPSINHETAMSLWAELRERSGLPPITDAYPDADIHTLIDLIHKERQVEFAQEGLRYYDIRTRMIGTSVNNGPVYGLDVYVRASINDKEVPAAMWKRAVVENRVFRINHHLNPFPQREFDRNKILTQNYGW